MKKHLFDLSIQADEGGYNNYITRYRRLLIRVFLLLGLPLFSEFALRAFLHHRYIAGSIMVGLVADLIFLFIISRKQVSDGKKAFLFELFLRVFAFLLFFFLFYATYIENRYHVLPWYFVLPILIFSAMGIREGIAWVVVITAILFYTTFKLDVPVNRDLITSLNTRLIMIFIVTSGFACLASYIAQTAIRKLFEKQEQLLASQNSLQKVNHRLEKEVADRKRIETRLNENEEKVRRLSDQTEQFSLTAASLIGMGDQQEIFNRISRTIVQHSDYRRVIISLFKDESPYRDIIGFCGIEADVINRLRTIEMPKNWYDGVFQKGIKVGRFSFYIPHTMKNILNQEATIFGEGAPTNDSDAWHPEDNLFVRMRGEKGEFVGVISVDDSKSGFQPTDEMVRPLEIFASLIVQIIILKKEQRQRKLLEEQLVQALKMESIGTLAGGVAHDFNNILAIILGNLELATEDLPIGHQSQMNLEEAMTASLRAKDLIRQLLSFSRPTDQSQQSLVIKPIVEESLKLMRSTLPANIEIQSELDDRVHPILADATQIHQVIINLCTNAVHAMPENGGQIQISLGERNLEKNGLEQARELMPGRYAMLEVSDTGHGIAPEHLSRIFDPYYSTKEVDKGTGMGLSVVYGIVKSTGGEIVVESQPEIGTTFKLFFPVVETKPLEEKEVIKEIPMGQGRILLVDDETALTKLGCQMLTRLGYEPKAFNDPVEALHWFEAHQNDIDMVITDMTMPHLSGAEVTEKIKQQRPDLPVVLCTGFNEYIDESGANELGVDAFVMKPLILKDLAQTIYKAIL